MYTGDLFSTLHAMLDENKGGEPEYPYPKASVVFAFVSVICPVQQRNGDSSIHTLGRSKRIKKDGGEN